MLCARESNFRLNRVHEIALRIISKDYMSSFSDLLTLLNEKTIHQRCINFFLTKVFKYQNGLSPELMNDAFKLKLNYQNHRSFGQFETYIPKTRSPLNSCI